MFSRARIKLTLWYLLIIGLIVISFSAVIFKDSTHEFDRIVRTQRLWMDYPNQLPIVLPEPRLVDRPLIQESEDRLKLMLVLTDFGILLLSAVASYFLAGRTLKPIEEMLSEQKRFVSDASHELRTPVTALKSEIEVGLRDKKLTLRQARELLQSNLEEADKLKQLTDYLLALGRYQGDNQIKIEEVNLNQVISEVKDRSEILAKPKRIKIKLEVSPIKLNGNKDSLVQLLFILLDNAIKFSPDYSTVQITAQKTNEVIIKVIDQGVGISLEDKTHIFDRFYQSEKARQGGYGLGLSIAKRIVELHSGSIDVSSNLGQGSTFIIKLPL